MASATTAFRLPGVLISPTEFLVPGFWRVPASGFSSRFLVSGFVS